MIKEIDIFACRLVASLADDTNIMKMISGEMGFPWFSVTIDIILKVEFDELLAVSGLGVAFEAIVKRIG